MVLSRASHSNEKNGCRFRCLVRRSVFCRFDSVYTLVFAHSPFLFPRFGFYWALVYDFVRSRGILLKSMSIPLTLSILLFEDGEILFKELTLFGSDEVLSK